MEDVESTHPVERVMSVGAIWIDERMTLRTLATELSDAQVGALLVRRSDDTAGIVSERDLVRALAAGADPDEVLATDLTTAPLVTVHVGERIGEAAQKMAAEDVRHLAVVDRGKIVGVVSVRDLLPVLAADVVATW